MPISLSDDELRIVMDCAQPLAPKDRDAFLRDVAAELEQRHQRGPGAIYRACRELQKKYFDPPISTSKQVRLRATSRARAEGGGGGPPRAAFGVGILRSYNSNVPSVSCQRDGGT